MQVSYSPERKSFLIDNLPVPPGVKVITFTANWPLYFNKTITDQMSQDEINLIVESAVAASKKTIIELYFQYTLPVNSMVKYIPTETPKMTAKLSRFQSIELQASVEKTQKKKKKKVRKVRKTKSRSVRKNK